MNSIAKKKIRLQIAHSFCEYSIIEIEIMGENNSAIKYTQ